MTRPSGMQIRAEMPRMKWFRIPTELKRAFPNSPDYELYNMRSSICNILNKDLKWGVVSKCTIGNDVFWCI